MKKLLLLGLLFGIFLSIMGQEEQVIYKANNGKNDIEYQSKDSDNLMIIDEMPQFPGGMQALTKYLNANLIYPEKARKDSITGEVFISFLINKKGKVQKTQIKKGVRADIDKEAYRVIKKMPKWKAGVQDGKAVSVWYTIPISFELN